MRAQIYESIVSDVAPNQNVHYYKTNPENQSMKIKIISLRMFYKRNIGTGIMQLAFKIFLIHGIAFQHLQKLDKVSKARHACE